MNRRTFVLVLGLVLMALTPTLTVTAQSGSGHTKLPVGNYPRGSLLPTGQFITPTAAPGSTIQLLETGLRADGNADAAQAVKAALSPDGTTLLVLVLTSGWNRSNVQPDGTPITFPTLDPVTGAQVGNTGNAEWVFVLSIANNGALVKQQQINVPSTYSGLAWAPDGSGFYVSGGNHDRVYVYRFDGTIGSHRLAPFLCLCDFTVQQARRDDFHQLQHRQRASDDGRPAGHRAPERQRRERGSDGRRVH